MLERKVHLHSHLLAVCMSLPLVFAKIIGYTSS